jgi:UDP-N-acetylglucosamine--N-acetylmuramyl-(pentapeptide) pyrophosphoryl-undecaprenol N-acetylglucosamine transferase
MAPTVVIAAGGTAGHVVPALAVADALRAEGARVSFIGARDRLEATLVPEAGYEVDLLDLSGLDRDNPVRAAGALRRAGAAVPRVRRLLRERGADAVLGGGGYVAAPAGLAAVSLRLPLVLTEADRHLGLTNRALARRARRVCLAFPIDGRDGPKFVVTGRPVPAAIGTADREAARRRFGIDADDGCLLVFGGSQGARSINVTALEAFTGPQAGDRDFHVLHISGSRDFALVGDLLAAAGAPPRYTLVEYEPNLADALAASDLVLARSGGSIFEVAAARRPAILVPYPHAAGDHQRANAEWMAEGGAAVVIADSDLDPARLRTTAAELLGDHERLERMAGASGQLARPDAAERVAAELLGAISEPDKR